MDRYLTITLSSDWKAGLRNAAESIVEGVNSGEYQGEQLNFESPAVFFGKLTERRWDLVRLLQNEKPSGVREIARLIGRDVRRVHDDLKILMELGLIEKESDMLICPYRDIHVDMHLKAA